MRDEVGKYLSLGVAAGIEQNSDEVVKAFDSMLEKLEYKRKFDIISEDEYYTELEKLRDKYLKAGSKEWLSYTEKIYSYQKSAVESQKTTSKISIMMFRPMPAKSSARLRKNRKATPKR